jgi:hypothetical protein
MKYPMVEKILASVGWLDFLYGWQESNLQDEYRLHGFDRFHKEIKENGVQPTGPVKLYRGMFKGAGYDSFQEFLDEIFQNKKEGDRVDIKFDRFSSWTSNLEVAKDFAYGMGYDNGGVVVSIIAQPKNVLVDVDKTIEKQQRGEIRGEDEFILYPNLYKVKIEEIRQPTKPFYTPQDEAVSREIRKKK